MKLAAAVAIILSLHAVVVATWSLPAATRALHARTATPGLARPGCLCASRLPRPLAFAASARASAEQSAVHDRRAGALVSTEWLQEQLDQANSNLVVLDVRGKVGKRDAGGGRVDTEYEALGDDFLAAHIPGAVFVDWTRDIVDLEDDTPVQLAPLDVFAGAMEEKGVGTDKTVVIYDTGKMLFATRLWWALTIYGHEDVRILNGGWQRWTLEGRETESDCTTCPLKLYASFEAREAYPTVDPSLPPPTLSLPPARTPRTRLLLPPPPLPPPCPPPVPSPHTSTSSSSSFGAK
jgi:hypothetical protein